MEFSSSSLGLTLRFHSYLPLNFYLPKSKIHLANIIELHSQCKCKWP